MFFQSRRRLQSSSRLAQRIVPMRRFRPVPEGLEGRTMMSGMPYVVNSRGDTPSGPGLPGDLRYAITQADSNPGSTIDITVEGTIQLARALPPLTSNMSILGPGLNPSTPGGPTLLTVAGGSASFSVFTVDNGVSASLQDISIQYGHATYGGAIYDDGSLTLVGCELLNNSATEGGAIFVASSGDGLTVYNYLHSSGGLSTTYLSDLDSNYASDSGSAIYNAGGTVTLNGTDVSNNGRNYSIAGTTHTTSNGGAIYNAGGTVTLNYTSLQNNWATYNGGGIDTVGGTINVNGGSSLKYNQALHGYGGAISSTGSTINLTGNNVYGGVSIMNNSANEGGALFFGGGVATISGTNFEYNNANTGGAIAGGGTLSLENSSLYSNTATYNGGGIWTAGGTVTLTNCIANWNRATQGEGGAISGPAVTLTDDTILSNSANEGGALFFSGGASITGTLFEFDNANTGGAIAGGGTLALNSSSLYFNTAQYNGGAIWSSGGSVTLTNCKVAGNKAVKGAGGAVDFPGGTVWLINTELWGNTSGQPGGINN